MPSVNQIAPGGCFPPSMRPLDVKVSSNDPTMTATTSGGGVVHVRGTASNNGFVPSFISVKFDGHSLTVPLSRGMTGADVQAAITEKLPKGYRIQSLPTFAATSDALFRIDRAPAPVKNDPAGVAAGFQKAQGQTTHAGTKLSVTELRKIVRDAKKDGFTQAEKTELARQWASTFTGAGFHATSAAQAEYAKLQKQFDLPVFPVR